MEDKQLFNQVLDADEEVVKTMRPQKFRAWFTSVISLVFLAIFFVPAGIVSFFDAELGAASGIWFLTIYAVFALVTIILMALWLNKTVYAITNKRVLIRTGYIGVDYKSLDFNMVGALTVNVNWIDKLLHKNTGSIAFGSMASPMVNNNVSKFVFSYISNPYEVYKEVKSYIDDKKKVDKTL